MDTLSCHVQNRNNYGYDKIGRMIAKSDSLSGTKINIDKNTGCLDTEISTHVGIPILASEEATSNILICR